MTTAQSSHDELCGAMNALGFTVSPGNKAITTLTGGVSADIWRVETERGPIVVKRALAQLRVSDQWQVSVSRNQNEVAWLKTVAKFAPGCVPEILASDAQASLFVMEYLPPGTHHIWKKELEKGNIDVDFAAEVARLLATIHAKTAENPALAAIFDTDDLFMALRPEPYFHAAAMRHPELKDPLEHLSNKLFQHKKALVHGDISPKNILHGPSGPVFLDAECAWYGDPAFDLTFCLSHLLLKTLWRPQWAEQYLSCVDTMRSAYLAGVDWEAPEALEQRVAQLLPALLLGRVDGKSPVEYLTDEQHREAVRRFASQYLLNPVTTISQLRTLWIEQVVDQVRAGTR